MISVSVSVVKRGCEECQRFEEHFTARTSRTTDDIFTSRQNAGIRCPCSHTSGNNLFSDAQQLHYVHYSRALEGLKVWVLDESMCARCVGEVCTRCPGDGCGPITDWYKSKIL